MQTHLITLAALAAFSTLAAADTPEAILKDYRTRATQATQRLNETLESQSSPIITDLLRKNDTAGAEAVATQVKAKLAGEPVASPHVALATLFAQYDGARATALHPVQKSSLSRLDSLLNVAGGPKSTDLEAITKAKAEVEAGRSSSNVASLFVGKSYWTRAGSEYHFNKDGSGYRLQTMDFNGKVVLTWTLRDDGIIEVSQRKTPTSPPTLTFFKFVDKKSAFQGDVDTSITTPLLVHK